MRYRRILPVALLGAIAVAMQATGPISAAGGLQPPDQFIGFKVGADNRLARWDAIVDYMRRAAAESPRVRLRELGATNGGNPLVLLEISAPDTIRNLDRYKQLQRRLYFQGGAPGARDRDEIFRQGKAVVLVTSSVHATEIGATQMALELVHQLATDESPAVKKILDNVILLLVPSANPDGQIMVVDWFARNLGTPFEHSPLPTLYHPYAGHDLNRDMYMLTQRESQYIARLAWHDWLPAVWLDQHQMDSHGPRIFVMPAADPINPNVHPLVYRWNGILGQSQAAALEAAGKDGIIYNNTYTNYWQGAMAWSGWWHNQIGLLTEVASARIAAPVEQLRAPAGPGYATASVPRDARRSAFDGTPLMPPTDTTPRTEYPRPWLGGRWTLRDVVDYELITTMALLETVADRRETLLRQVYEINRQTAERGIQGVSAILIPAEKQHDPREAGHLVERLRLAGVEVYRADAPFEGDGHSYPSGTFIVPMTQVFARYAKDLLERQTYPEVRRTPDAPAEPPYDVTAWSLGMLLGVKVEFLATPLPPQVAMSRVAHAPRRTGQITGKGSQYTFGYAGADTALAINRLLKAGASVALERPSRVVVRNIARERLEPVARELGLAVTAADTPAGGRADTNDGTIRAPRVGVYAPWTSGNMDEGWTRWVLETYEFAPATLHNAEIRAGNLRQRFDVIVIPDQSPREIVEGYNTTTIRPEYRGGIGDAGLEHLKRFMAEGGTVVLLGTASDLAIDRWAVPVRNIKRNVRRDQHSAPGTILHLDVDVDHPLGYGMAADSFGFYTNGPFFSADRFSSRDVTVIARYPGSGIVASGWLKGEELMVGRAAMVAVDMSPGRLVLFGLRPQHRGQTHATFPLLFNALYQSTVDGAAAPN